MTKRNLTVLVSMLAAAFRAWWSPPLPKSPPVLTPVDVGAFRSFERAFSARIGSCRGECACGRQFFDNNDASWDWEEGELEALLADPRATSVEGVGYIEFEGQTFVDSCDCWHARAKQIIRFLHGHDFKIAEFLTLEKQRVTRLGDIAPVVR